MTKRVISGVFLLVALGALGLILAGALTSGEQLIVRFLTAVIVAGLGLYVISDLRLQADDDKAATSSRRRSSASDPAKAAAPKPKPKPKAPATAATETVPANSTAAFMATVGGKRAPTTASLDASGWGREHGPGPGRVPHRTGEHRTVTDELTFGDRNRNRPSRRRSAEERAARAERARDGGLGVFDTGARHAGRRVEHGDGPRADEIAAVDAPIEPVGDEVTVDDDPYRADAIGAESWPYVDSAEHDAAEEEPASVAAFLDDHTTAPADLGADRGVAPFVADDATIDLRGEGHFGPRRSIPHDAVAPFISPGATIDLRTEGVSDADPLEDETDSGDHVDASEASAGAASADHVVIDLAHPSPIDRTPLPIEADGPVADADAHDDPVEHDAADATADGEMTDGTTAQAHADEATEEQPSEAHTDGATAEAGTAEADVDQDAAAAHRAHGDEDEAGERAEDAHAEPSDPHTVALRRAQAELEAAAYARRGIIDLRTDADASAAIEAAIRSGERSIIASLIDDGALSAAGPISDRDVRTMVYVAFTSSELRKILVSGGTMDGVDADVDLGPVEVFAPRPHRPVTAGTPTGDSSAPAVEASTADQTPAPARASHSASGAVPVQHTHARSRSSAVPQPIGGEDGPEAGDDPAGGPDIDLIVETADVDGHGDVAADPAESALVAAGWGPSDQDL